MRRRRSSREANAPPHTLAQYDDLTVQILARLPVKSLMRFRCVSKSWNSLFSDRHFVNQHLHRSRSGDEFVHRQVILTPFGGRASSVSWSMLSFLEDPSSVDLRFRPPSRNDYGVIGSCNGLVCIVASLSRKNCKKYWFQLLNPATRLRSKNSPILSVALGNRDTCFTQFGFGYDQLSDTYKVVAINSRSLKKEESDTVQVYSVGGGNGWRNIECFPGVPTRRRNIGVYLSGTLNWLAWTTSDDNYVNIDDLVIVSLDMGNERFRQLKLPSSLDGAFNYVDTSLSAMRDCLCVSHDFDGTHLIVWQMKEFGVEESWTQLLKLSYGNLLTQSPPLPFSMSQKDDLLMLTYRDVDTNAILYNLKDEPLGRRLAIPKKNIHFLYSRDHVESLVSPCLI